MGKVVIPQATVLDQNNRFIESKGKVWQFSIANEGSSVLNMGIRGKGIPFLSIPAKPDDGPAYPRVWSTNNPDIPFGVDFEITFEGGVGEAHLVTFVTNDSDQSNNSENIPKTQ